MNLFLDTLFTDNNQWKLPLKYHKKTCFTLITVQSSSKSAVVSQICLCIGCIGCNTAFPLMDQGDKWQNQALFCQNALGGCLLDQQTISKLQLPGMHVTTFMSQSFLLACFATVIRANEYLRRIIVIRLLQQNIVWGSILHPTCCTVSWYYWKSLKKWIDSMNIQVNNPQLPWESQSVHCVLDKISGHHKFYNHVFQFSYRTNCS